MNYEQAKANYKYRDPYVGYQLSRYVFLKYNPEEDCFVVNELMSKNKYIPDPEPDNHANTKYAAHKHLWQFRPFAKIYKDRTEVFFEARSMVTDAIGLTHSKPSSKKLSGRLWHYHRCPNIQGELPITIRGHKIEVSPPKVRMTNREKRVEMNRMIQKIRKLLTVRTKIGAFKNVTSMVIREHVSTSWRSQWQVRNTPGEFLKLMNAVVEDDITTFYPLLYMAEQNASWSMDHDKINGEDLWVKYFNKLVDSMREKMRVDMGVVTYVAADERGADSSDDCVEIDRAA